MAGQWLYQRGGQQFGPVSTEQLQSLAQMGQLLPTDLVWTDGMGSWMEASKAGGIFDTGPAQPMPQQPIPQQPTLAQPFAQPPPSQPIPGMAQPGMGQPVPQPMPQQPVPQPMPPQPAPQPMPPQPMPQQPIAQQPVPQQPIPQPVPQQPVPQQPIPQPISQPIPQPIPQPPTTPMEPETKKKKKKPTEWFFMKGEKRCGPISSQHLRERANTGKLGPDEIVWREGLDEWIPAKKVQGLSFSNKSGISVSISTAESTLPNLAGPPTGKSKIKSKAATSSKIRRKKKSPGKKTSKPKSKTAAEPEKKKKKKVKKTREKKKGKETSEPLAKEDRDARIQKLQEEMQRLRKAIVEQVLEESDDLADVKAIAQFCDRRSALQQQVDDGNERAEQLRQVQTELEPVDTAWRTKADELADAETGLVQNTEALGTTAFAAWIAGTIPDNDIFAQRLEIHQGIMDLEQQRERLEAQSEAGKVEEAKAKADGLILASKLKTEEAKIPGLDAEVGKQLINSPDLINVECAETSEVLAKISELKSKAKELRPQVEQTRAALDAKKEDLAKSLKLKDVSSGEVLAAEIQQCEKSVKGKEKERLALEEGLPEKILADKYAPDEGKISDLLDEYEDADDELKELAPEGSIVGGIGSAAKAAIAMGGAVWQGLKMWQKIVAAAVPAAVLLAIVYFLFFAGGGTPETPSPETPGEPAAEQPDDTPAEPLKTQTGPVTAPVP